MRKFILICLTTLSVLGARSQYHHEAGASYFLAFDQYDFIALPAGSYVARLNIAEPSEGFSMSMVAIPSAAVALNLNARFGSNGYFAGDLPILFQINAGARATDDSEANFGAFLGAGGGINYLANGSTFWGSTSAWTYGPAASVGLRFPVRQQPISVRGSILAGVGKSAGNYVVGLSATYAL